MAAEPLLFLTGHVAAIFPPGLATKKIWPQEVILRVAARNQPAEELVKIQFAEEHMSLLDELRLNEHVAVGLSVRGVDCYQGWRKQISGCSHGSATNNYPEA